jgi:hypothetical protein
MTERPGEPSDPSSSFSDEDWARFQEEAATTVRARGDGVPKEPSARARQVTARLKSLDEQAAAERGPRRWSLRRGRRKKAAAEPEPWQPEGWRTGPAWREMQGGGRRWRKSLAMVCAGAFVAVAFLGVGAMAHRHGWWGTDDSNAEPLLAETVAPTTAPPTSDPDLPTLQHPFAGSPARRWAAGADAIRLPAATSVNGVAKQLVADSLHQTKRFLVAANLDRDVLGGGRPDQALALVDPLQKDYLASLRHSLDHPTADDSPTDVFTRFDPDEVRPVGDVVKVRGHMTVKAGDKPGRAEIHADYTFVYPVTRASGADDVTRTVVRRVVDALVATKASARVTPGTLWILRSDGDIANSTCVSRDGLLHPQFRTDPGDGPAPSGPTTDPYDRSTPLASTPQDDACGTVSRI